MQQHRSFVNEPDFVRVMASQRPSDLRTDFVRTIVIPNASIRAGNVRPASRVHVMESGHGGICRTGVDIIQPADRTVGWSAPQH